MDDEERLHPMERDPGNGAPTVAHAVRGYRFTDIQVVRSPARTVRRSDDPVRTWSTAAAARHFEEPDNARAEGYERGSGSRRRRRDSTVENQHGTRQFLVI